MGKNTEQTAAVLSFFCCRLVQRLISSNSLKCMSGCAFIPKPSKRESVVFSSQWKGGNYTEHRAPFSASKNHPDTFISDHSRIWSGKCTLSGHNVIKPLNNTRRPGFSQILVEFFYSLLSLVLQTIKIHAATSLQRNQSLSVGALIILQDSRWSKTISSSMVSKSQQ